VREGLGQNPKEWGNFERFFKIKGFWAKDSSGYLGKFFGTRPTQKEKDWEGIFFSLFGFCLLPTF